MHIIELQHLFDCKALLPLRTARQCGFALAGEKVIQLFTGDIHAELIEHGFPYIAEHLFLIVLVHHNFIGIMAREKIKFALRIAPETQQLVKELCERDNCQSQNEFIEKAIRFYAGYVSGKEATAYLPPALVAAMRGTVQDSENRIARLLFKLAVEVNMMMNVLAAGMEISDEDLKTLRARSVREVKQTNGRISFKDAIDYQRGVE